MGLSATQAHSLLTVSRKIDVEAGLMDVSNQLMILSRNSSEISQKYSNALNATKLTWNTGGNSVDLSYDLLMRPNTVADSGQYILTNASSGKVLLDSTYITSLGLGASGSGSQFRAKFPTAQSFAAAMMGGGYTPEAVGGLVGSGSDPVSSNTSISASYSDSDIWNYLSDEKDGNGNGYSLDGSSRVIMLTETELYGNKNGKTSTVQDIMKAYVGDICEDVSSALTNLLGSDSNIASALSSATSATQKYYYNDIQDEHDNEDDSWARKNKAKDAAKDGNGIGVDYSGTDEIYIDSSQIVKTFLNYFDAACATLGGDNELAETYKAQVGDDGHAANRTKNGGVSINSNDTPDAGNPISDSNTNEIGDSYEAAYYIRMYNAIASSGWQSSENISSDKYLQNQVLNGNIAIKQYNSASNSWKALSSSTSTSPLNSESDTQAQDKAEAEYEADKDKISYKEARLNMRKTQLDAELSELNTLSESLKKILDKHTSEDFKYFQA